MALTEELLTESVVERCRGRAAGYDRENRFFVEDFEELRAAGYLKAVVPTELGGSGLSLADSCRLTRRLAGYAPATALGLNMHTYWVGVAADLWRAGTSTATSCPSSDVSRTPLQRVSRALAFHVVMREPPQLRVHDRHEPIPRRGVLAGPGIQQLRHLLGRKGVVRLGLHQRCRRRAINSPRSSREASVSLCRCCITK